MELDQRRRWDRFARDFAELLKRLESGTFPTREDWKLVLGIETVAEELGRPSPVRMAVENLFDGWGSLVVRSYFGPERNLLERRDGPVASIVVTRVIQYYFPTFDDATESVADLAIWSTSLSDVATFLAGTWLPTIELARPIELSGKARRTVELLAKRPNGMLGKDLAKELRSEEKNLGRDLADAIEKGLVENPRDGYGYRLTVLGRAWADGHLATDPEGSPRVREGPARVRDGKSKAR